MKTLIKIALTVLLATAFRAAAKPQKDNSDGQQHRFVVATSIGLSEAKNDEDRPYMFSLILSPDFDSEGNIYVLDYKEACVKVFTPSGRFHGRFLSPGRGKLRTPFA